MVARQPRRWLPLWNRQFDQGKVFHSTVVGFIKALIIILVDNLAYILCIGFDGIEIKVILMNISWELHQYYILDLVELKSRIAPMN